MNFGAEGYIAQVAAFCLFVFLIAGVMIAVRRRRWRPDDNGCVPDEAEGTPYRIYTDEFDLELRGAGAVQALPGASLDRERGHLHRTSSLWKAWIRRSNALVKRNERLTEELLPYLRTSLAGLDPDRIAVALLIDQSGSMKGEPIAHAAAGADLFARLFATLGIRNEVLGFSTAGWRGGRAYEKWKFGGQPKRPGRLCALMHVIYKAATEPALADAAREAIVHPDLLRENVDGEAIIWARSRLAALPVRHRLILVLSDGAPVDDATITHNGLSFLHRHLVTVVKELEADGLIVGGLGINHRVDADYPRAETVAALDDLPAAMMRVLGRMIEAASQRAAAPA